MSAPKLAIIVPMFNREWSIVRALRSAFGFLQQIGGGEVIIVDDGSTDDSVRNTEEFLSGQPPGPVVARLVQMPRNQGVCAARNAGVAAASADWVTFLDSDDEMIESSARALLSVLDGPQCAPLNFFRCIDESGNEVGGALSSPVRLELNDFIVRGTSGESLPVVSRDAFLETLFDEDMPGFESLCYTRIVRKTAAAWIHPLQVRRYYTSHEDRLSSRTGMRRRSGSLARGYRRLLGEHLTVLSWRARAFILSRALYHQARSIVQ
jgi:glycosyltransferase involved in cell wall biosynthesis